MKHLVLALVAAATLSVPAMAQNRVKNVYTSSRTLDVQMLQNNDQTVQLNRYLFAGYNTLCLPMSMSADQLSAAEVSVERLAAIAQQGTVLRLYFIDCTSEGIEAGMPYLVYSAKQQYLRAKTTEAETISSELTTVRMTDDKGNQVAFSSSWEAVEKDGLYGIPAQQNVTPLESVLIRTSADKSFLPTRCGFSWEQQSPTASDIEIVHINSLAELGALGISSLNSPDALVDVYDLKGNVVRRQVKNADMKNSLPRGLYIVGGQKVSVN